MGAIDPRHQRVRQIPNPTAVSGQFVKLIPVFSPSNLLGLDFIEEYKIYKPIIDVSQFWLLSKDYVFLDPTSNETSEEINVTLSFNTYWSMKFLMQTQMQQSLGIYSDYGLMDQDAGLEEMKEMFTETNVYLLAVTMIVSFMHSFFEILVLKNGKIKTLALYYPI